MNHLGKYTHHSFQLQDLIPIFAHHGQCHDIRHILRIFYGLRGHEAHRGIPGRQAIAREQNGILRR